MLKCPSFRWFYTALGRLHPKRLETAVGTPHSEASLGWGPSPQHTEECFLLVYTVIGMLFSSYTPSQPASRLRSAEAKSIRSERANPAHLILPGQKDSVGPNGQSTVICLVLGAPERLETMCAGSPAPSPWSMGIFSSLILTELS